MKKSIFILSIFALLNSCSKTEDPVIKTYYIEAAAICNNPPSIITYNTTTRVGYVQFGYGNSFTPAANKWYKTTMVNVSPSGSVPVYIKIGQNISPVPWNERVSMILPYNVTDFKEYNSPCQ